ncbi:conserved protein, unknown function [Hepatocystis sp. ex Piliocolobus tephrosceles]|nr:conserved protein, unknown function [Hepatocystis sp. ex Piliocolobus tephrosceles]
MNISIKESLEHICEVLSYFGIEYITPEIFRRGKNDKKVKRKKVIIKYTYLINDLCLLYIFEFKRKFKPTYNEYIKKQILITEEQYISSNRSVSNVSNKNESNRNELKRESGDDYEQDNNNNESNSDNEEYNAEHLDEDVHYLDDFYLISPIVVFLLEYFQYPRLYQLLKCNFQMAKELLLCIGFLIDCIDLFGHYDKRQNFYINFFNYFINNNNNSNNNKGRNRVGDWNLTNNIKQNKKQSNEKLNNNNKEEEEEGFDFFYNINEAMLLLSNRPYDLELFSYKHFYKFLNKLKNVNLINGDINVGMGMSGEEKTKQFTKSSAKLRKKVQTNVGLSKTKNSCNNDGDDENESEEMKTEINKNKQNDLDLYSYASYNYSTYEEQFLTNYYYMNINYDQVIKNDLLLYLNEDVHNIISIKKLLKNININSNKLIQLHKNIIFSINKIYNYDKSRLLLFQKFQDLINAYTQTHNVVVHLPNTTNGDNITKPTTQSDFSVDKKKKINLMDNVIFTVNIDIEQDQKNLEKLLNIKNNETGGNKKSNINSSYQNKTNNFLNKEQYNNNFVFDPTDNIENINYDILYDKITINELYILNDINLYNNIIHIYKNGINFFYYEKLRSIFWIWLQSIFNEDINVEFETKNRQNKNSTVIDFDDININQFFKDITTEKQSENLSIHVLSDLNNFEANYKKIKDYFHERGLSGCDGKNVKMEKKNVDINKLNSIKKYIHNLQLEFEAFYNYKKRAKDISEDMFVNFLNEKKKNIVINSNVEKEDYTILSNILNTKLINIDKVLKTFYILNFSNIVEGIKEQNFIRTAVNVHDLDTLDWANIYNNSKKKKNTTTTTSGENKNKNSDDDSITIIDNKDYIINLTANSKYGLNKPPTTYASTIFKYSDQFISNNDVYTFSDNIKKKNEQLCNIAEDKQNKCIHNFYHVLRKVEKYMDCVAYNL